MLGDRQHLHKCQVMKSKIINPDVIISTIGRKRNNKEMVVTASAGVFFTLAVWIAIKKFKSKPNNPSAKIDKKFVFFSAEGQAKILSEQDVYDIVKMYEGGVMPNVIASKYDLNTVMVCRIVNCFNSINKNTNLEEDYNPILLKQKKHEES